MALTADTDRARCAPAMPNGATCLDLRERFGDGYRIGWEADGATKGAWPREEWPWLIELRCRYGKISPKGGETLQAFTDKPRMGAKLRKLPCVLKAKGDLEVVVEFHVDDIEQLLGILKPYRRRQASPAERERLRAVGAVHRFKRKAGEHGSESEHSELESTNGAGNGLEYGRVASDPFRGAPGQRRDRELTNADSVKAGSGEARDEHGGELANAQPQEGAQPVAVTVDTDRGHPEAAMPSGLAELRPIARVRRCFPTSRVLQ